MYRQILVPLDGSRTAERALPYAAWLARPSGARVHLVHVARPDAEAPAVGAAQAYLNCVARALRVRGVAVATLVVAGEVAPALAGVARAGAADLLVLATHDRRGFDRLAHGSVAAAVLARAPAPVLLVRPGLPPPRALARPGARPRVLVPLDGSAFAAALPAACALADALGGDLVLLRATSPGAGARAAETELRALADQLRTAARTVAVDLREGEPAAAIAAAARDHGVAVVAMATHDRAGAERHPQGGTHLGSGAADALRRCAVPVLLVRPPALRLAPEAGAPA